MGMRKYDTEDGLYVYFDASDIDDASLSYIPHDVAERASYVEAVHKRTGLAKVLKNRRGHHGIIPWTTEGGGAQVTATCPTCRQVVPDASAQDGANLLRAWLRDNGKSQAWFAAEVGVTDSAVSRLLSGENAPSTTLALAVECLTGGRVPRASWPKITSSMRAGAERGR